ncbi:MAG: DUF4062 domain-containing protein [Proteobacteria bacterium]|nr:DUF4062 domain-containing protein [Pseudomonadota bacterium]
MEQNITIRVFVASPGDVPEERDTLPRVVDELNKTIGPQNDCHLEAIRWETHTAPGAGRPQAVINDQIGSYDIFVGIMWRRFGTPSGIAASGTEEEYRRAYKQWESDQNTILMFYFRETPFYPKTIDELEQMKQVLSFRKELDGKALVWTYETPNDFEGFIRKHLGLRVPRLVQERKATVQNRAEPNDESVQMVRDFWVRMSPELQRACCIAYNENRLAGDPGIQTRDLFAALQRVGSPAIQAIVSGIPSAALPEPTAGPVNDTDYIVTERPWLSSCVESSVRRLSKALPSGDLLSGADVFADIAKNGHGTSVALLRKHNVGPSEIDRILKEKGVRVVDA